MLNPTQGLALLLPLAATLLAVLKDTVKEHPAGSSGTRINRFGVAALGLAFVGFATSWYSTEKSNRDARVKETDEQYFRNSVRAALDRELPGSITRAIDKSRHELELSVSSAVATSQDSLTGGIERTTATMGTRLSALLFDVQKGIVDSIGTATRHSNEYLVGTVRAAVDSSSEKLRAATDTTISRQAGRMGDMAERAMATQIMQIPLTIEQRSRRRLGGLISDMALIVGDVATDHPFCVELLHDVRGRIASWEIRPDKKRKGEVHTLGFDHPVSGRSFTLETAVHSQRNLLGSGTDYVVVRVVHDQQPATGEAVRSECRAGDMPRAT